MDFNSNYRSKSKRNEWTMRKEIKLSRSRGLLAGNYFHNRFPCFSYLSFLLSSISDNLILIRSDCISNLKAQLFPSTFYLLLFLPAPAVKGENEALASPFKGGRIAPATPTVVEINWNANQHRLECHPLCYVPDSSLIVTRLVDTRAANSFFQHKTVRLCKWKFEKRLAEVGIMGIVQSALD